MNKNTYYIKLRQNPFIKIWKKVKVYDFWMIHTERHLCNGLVIDFLG